MLTMLNHALFQMSHSVGHFGPIFADQLNPEQPMGDWSKEIVVKLAKYVSLDNVPKL
jgi:hypothetical protein